MPAEPPEYKLETLAIAILAAHASFAGVDIEHHVEDDDTAEKGNRVTVKVDPATPKVTAHRPDKKAPVLQSTLTVTLKHADETTLLDWWAAADAALNPTSFAAGIVTAATAAFPNGVVIETGDGGGLVGGPSNRHELTRTYPVVFRT